MQKPTAFKNWRSEKKIFYIESEEKQRGKVSVKRFFLLAYVRGEKPKIEGVGVRRDKKNLPQT